MGLGELEASVAMSQLLNLSYALKNIYEIFIFFNFVSGGLTDIDGSKGGDKTYTRPQLVILTTF